MRINSSLAPSTNPSKRAQYQQQLRKLERRREEIMRKLNQAAGNGGGGGGGGGGGSVSLGQGGSQPVPSIGAAETQAAAAPVTLGSGQTKPAASTSRSENTSKESANESEAGLDQMVRDALRQAPVTPVEAADIKPRMRELRAQDRQVTAETLQLKMAQAQEAAAQGGAGGGGGGGGSPADSMEMLQQELMLIEQQIAQVQKQMNEASAVPQVPQAGAGESSDPVEAVNNRLALSAAGSGGGGSGREYPPVTVDAAGHVDGYA